MDDEEKKPQLSCDSCGWIIKPGEVYAEMGNEITCEHCLDQSGRPEVLH